MSGPKALSQAAGPRRLRKEERSRPRQQNPGCSRRRRRQAQGTMILPSSHSPRERGSRNEGGRQRSCRRWSLWRRLAAGHLVISSKRGSGKNSLRTNRRTNQGRSLPYDKEIGSCEDEANGNGKANRKTASLVRAISKRYQGDISLPITGKDPEFLSIHCWGLRPDPSIFMKEELHEQN